MRNAASEVVRDISKQFVIAAGEAGQWHLTHHKGEAERECEHGHTLQPKGARGLLRAMDGEFDYGLAIWLALAGTVVATMLGLAVWEEWIRPLWRKLFGN